MQVGEESYSLKRLERHPEFQRLENRARAGGGAIGAYEQWLETGDEELREAIRAYNEDDCRSTLSLRNWLDGDMKPEAIREFGRDAFAAAPPEEPSDPPKWLPEILELVERLETGLPADPS